MNSQDNVFKSACSEIVSEAILVAKSRIFCNSWQAGFLKLLHVHNEVASHCRLHVTYGMQQFLSIRLSSGFMVI